MVDIGQCATLHIVVVVSYTTTVDVVVGVDTGAVDRAGVGICAGAGTGIVGSNRTHTVAG